LPEVNFKFNLALSILEKLQVPLGWCSSGLRANEYTPMPSDDNPTTSEVANKPPTPV
jgi:hypothetical protein